MATNKYDSLFIQDDEPIESLRPKIPPPPFEECSSSESEGEPEAPKPRVLARHGKPPLIFARPAYGNQYRAPPAPTTLAWRPSDDPEKHAEDIRQVNEVLYSAWKRRAARPRSDINIDNPPRPHKMAPASIDSRGDHTTPPMSDHSLRQTTSRTGGLTGSERIGHPSQLRPQRSRDGAAEKRARAESEETDLGRAAKKANFVAASSMLLSFFENGDQNEDD